MIKLIFFLSIIIVSYSFVNNNLEPYSLDNEFFTYNTIIKNNLFGNLNDFTRIKSFGTEKYLPYGKLSIVLIYFLFIRRLD